MKKRRISPVEALQKTISYIILLLLAVVTLFPVVYSLCGSFKETQELMVSSSLLPKHFTLNNYITAWQKVDYARYTFNSVVVAVLAVALNLINTSMTAYVLSRRKFLGKKIIAGMYTASMFISVGPAALYPTYSILVHTGMNNNLLGLIIISAVGGAANIFLTRGYLDGISKDFDDAARIDGCSFFGIYWRIILPMMGPIIGVVGLLVFRGTWNNYLLPMIITTGHEELMTLPVATVALKSSGGNATQWSVLLAAANITLIPMILVYILCNKQFVNGITAGGIKG